MIMKKIGEISSLYKVSNRMLRYYEDKKLIKCIRKDNNYRFFTQEQEEKIQLILLLKELDFSVDEMRKVFTITSAFDMIELLSSKKRELAKKSAELLKLDNIMSNFIYLLTISSQPIYDSLSISLENPSNKMKGKIQMNQENVRILQLPKMNVIFFKSLSESPEDDTWKKVKAYVSKHQLKNFRHFGFNNPNPTTDSKIYGYEMWLTVDSDYHDEEVEMRVFDGGLYASITTYLENITLRWKELTQLIADSSEYEIDFVENDQFGVSKHQWLEECTNYEMFVDDSIDFSKKQLDLLLPIKKKS